MSDSRQHDLLAYWSALGGEGRLPGRTDVDPVDIPNAAEILPWLCLVEVHCSANGQGTDEDLRFRHRLIGTGIAARLGRDSTGRWFDELYEGTYRIENLGDYRDVVETGRPVLRQRQVPVTGKEFLTFERLALPLASDGETVDMVLSLVLYQSAAEAEEA